MPRSSHLQWNKHQNTLPVCVAVFDVRDIERRGRDGF